MLTSLIFNYFWYYALFLVLQRIYFIIDSLYRHFFRLGLNLEERFGKDSWALVTGGSDGIGKGFAMGFAQKGFNIIIVGRNPKKLKEVEEEIKKSTDKPIKTMSVVFDFCEKTSIADYKEMYNSVKNLDVSVVVNNIGWTNTKFFTEHTGEAIQNHISLNVIPQGLLSVMYVKDFKKRAQKGKRSCFINLSSFGGMFVFPKFITYNAVKSYNNVLSKLVHFECNDFVDSLSLKPMWVATPLTQMKEGDNYNIISVEKLVSSTLKQVGFEYETYGAFKHELHASIFLSKFSLIMKNILQINKKSGEKRTDRNLQNEKVKNKKE